MKKIAPIIYYIISFVLVIAFILKCVSDYLLYSTTLNSAPFYVWIFANVVQFIVPSIIIFAIGLFIMKKINN